MTYLWDGQPEAMKCMKIQALELPLFLFDYSKTVWNAQGVLSPENLESMYD